MSDQLAAAAAALGLPEALVERSARARAAETGAAVDEVLNEWAGGEAAPRPEPSAAAPAASDETAETAEPDEPDAEPAVTPEIVVAMPETTRVPEPIAAGPYKPPVLVGAKDNPMAILTGVVGLFLIVVMVGLVGPSIPFDTPGARSSNLPYTEAALDGQHLYQTTGCAGCHTQMVRPIVADVGLGPVSLNDSNQVLGTRRFGPDLSDVGSRVTAGQIEAIIGGFGGHPTQRLSAEDLGNLVAYLSESRTGPDQGAAS